MLKRFIIMAALVFVNACDGHCTHPWDGTPGSCPQSGVGDGTIGGSCASWPANPCGAGSQCVDGTCVACGGAGEICCGQYTANPKPCVAGTCVSTNDYNTCDDSCGLLDPGKDGCCPGDICSEGVCDVATSKCVAPAAPDPCPGGAIGYTISLKDSAGCATDPIAFTADDDTAAKTCADAIMAAAGYPARCEVDQAPTYTEVCEGAQVNDTVVVCDQADFAKCELSFCSNCQFTPGPCQ